MKSLCRNCKQFPIIWKGTWMGCCVLPSKEFGYVPSDNLEYLEWLYNKRNLTNESFS